MNRRTFIRLVLSAGVLGILIFWLIRRWYYPGGVDLTELTEKKGLIAALADTIIPETESPGAAGADVAAFIIAIVKDCSSAREQHTFMSGLYRVDEYAMRKYDAPFAACSEIDRINVLEHFEEQAVSRFAMLNKVKNKLFGEPFIVQLKRLSIEGYCTSELGATQGLAYDYIPVHYEACTLLTPGQKAWATN